MLKNCIKKRITNQFLRAGIQVNGPNPWDPQIKEEEFFPRVLFEGSLGLGESYMDEWFDVEQLDEFIYRILAAGLSRDSFLHSLVTWMATVIYNPQSKKRSLVVGKQHYDLCPHLFQDMLDKRMTYSCAYWRNAKNLDEAQEAKLDLICRKLYLRPGMKVLDVGCGWGSFSKFAAEKYGVQVVGITISQQQLAHGRELCQGLPVELRFQDYRDVNEQFDRIVSVGQMEHVGYKNYAEYMKIMNRCLTKEGLFLLHTIGSNYSVYATDPWIDKYIFPNGMLPSIAQLASSSEHLFIVEDLHNFGPDYDKTLMAWFENFKDHWDEIKKFYDNRFFRMWKYYLLSCAGGFRARELELWQFVFSKGGFPEEYESVR